MKSIQKVVNTVHQETIDYPSNHEKGTMPLLDLEQWIEQIEIEGDKKYKSEIPTTVYEKYC